MNELGLTFHQHIGCMEFKVTFQRQEDGGLVGCFGFNSPLRQYFSLYRAVSQREGEKGEKR